MTRRTRADRPVDARHHPPAPRGDVTLWVLRVALTAQAVALVAQPVLIGLYLDGEYDRLAEHRLIGGSLLPVITTLAALAVGLHVRVGRGPWHPVFAMAVLFVAEGLQIGMGYARVLAVHVPLGIFVVGCGLALAVWSWTPNGRRRRRDGDATSTQRPDPPDDVADPPVADPTEVRS